MNDRKLVIVGESVLTALAASIAIASGRSSEVRVAEITPDKIADGHFGFAEDESPDDTDVFAAIGPSALNYARFDLWAKLRLVGYRCVTLIHPTAIVGPGATFGDNVLVGPTAVVEPGVSIGRGVIVGTAAVLGGGTSVGDWCWLARGALLGSRVSVGSHVVMGQGVQVADDTEIPGPAEINCPGSYAGKLARGTFISREFPLYGAHLISKH